MKAKVREQEARMVMEGRESEPVTVYRYWVETVKASYII